jgi:hypothetical protein
MIPANLIHDSFNVPSLAGMGSLGLFDSTDVTQWGAGEIVALLAGSYFAIRLFHDVKSVGSATGKKAKKGKRKVSKAVTSGTSTIGKVAVVVGIGVAGYAAYTYSQGGTQ